MLCAVFCVLGSFGDYRMLFDAMQEVQRSSSVVVLTEVDFWSHQAVVIDRYFRKCRCEASFSKRPILYFLNKEFTL